MVGSGRISKNVLSFSSPTLFYFIYFCFICLFLSILFTLILFSSFPALCSSPASLFTSFFFLFQPYDFFPCVIFPFFCMTLSLSLSTLLSPLPSLISTRAAGEISRNPLPPFPTRHWWSVSESIQSTDHTGTHPDHLVMQTSVYEPLSSTRTGPYFSHLYSRCLWIKLFHSLVGVCWQAAASWWLLMVRLVPFTAGVLCFEVFS